MNNDSLAETITKIVLPKFRDQVQQYSGRFLTLYFEQTERYADSFVYLERAGRGFLKLKNPLSDDPITEIQVAITLKPSVTGGRWVGYNICIVNPETMPKLDYIQKWFEEGGAENTTNEEIQQILPNIVELIDVPVLLPPGTKPPRESPDAMY